MKEMKSSIITATPDLLKLCQYDYKIVIKGFQKFAKDIFDGNDENQKKDLLEILLDLVKNSGISRNGQPVKLMKRPLEVKDEVKNEPIEENVAKKPKHDQGTKVQVPYDIWLKIMNYLDTKDLFKNFNLACRKFNFMSMDSNAVKYLTLTSITEDTDLKIVNKVIRRSKLLVEIKIDQCPKYWKTLMLEALKKPKLKSIKIQNSTSDVPFPGEKVKNLGKNLEHLDLQEVKYNDKILREIAKIKTLKSLTNIWIDQNVLPTITEHCNQLESITIDAKHGIKPVLDNFFQKRGKILKSITVHGLGAWSSIHNEGNILEYINHCENLENISLNDLGSMITVFNLPKLKRLHIKEFHGTTDELKNLFQNLNRSNLREICLKNMSKFTFQDAFLLHLMANMEFPELERFYVQSKTLGDFNCENDFVNERTINIMLEKSPNIKSIQLYGKRNRRFDSVISTEFMKDLCINRGIYVDFRFGNLNQTWLENYLMEQGPDVRMNYLKMKSDLPKFRSEYE